MHSLIDAGCFAGRDVETGFDYPAERLLADFDRYGVTQGLVGSYRCIYQDVEEGNREVARWASQWPDRIIPLGIIHPTYYGQSPKQLLGWLKEGLSIQVVALFSAPAYYPVDWDSPTVRWIGEAAAELEMVLQAGIRTEAELAGVLRAWGDLSVPVMVRWMAGHRYKVLASEVALASRCPRFVFDVGNMNSIGMIEHAVETLGAARLFFASNSPHVLTAAPHGILHEAVLTEEQRRLIHAETLRHLLHKHSSTALQPVGSRYHTDEWTRLCTRPKVDVHWHPDHWNLGEPGLNMADQLAVFDRYGYERVVCSAIQALNYDLEAGNALTAAWCERDPRIYGLIVVNPLRLPESLAAIDRYAEHSRFVGVKTIQDLFGLGLDDPCYERLLVKAADNNLPVMAHIPGMEQAARHHPELTFIATHANWGRAQGLLELPNVVFDFSTGHALRHETQLARFLHTVGVERVLFGSDGPLVSPAWSLSKLMEVGPDATTLEAVLRANAYRLFPKLRSCAEVGAPCPTSR